jgi:ParB-like chromosome segregation protein Spo0J/DNA modification methylase
VEIETVTIESLRLDPNNARKHDTRNLSAISESLRRFGQRKPLVVTHGSVVIAGNGTLEAAKSLGWSDIAVTRAPQDWSTDQVKAYALADNRSAELAEWDESIMAEQLIELDEMGWDVQALGFDMPTLDDLEKGPSPKLADKFIVPPLSVLDQRSGDWQQRKKSWLSLGLRSEVGRGETLTLASKSGSVPDYYWQKEAAEKRAGRKLDNAEFERDYLTFSDTAGLSSTGTSVFDPVLCELAYRWFSPADGVVLDPFAGGVVRGAIAAALGRRYIGVDLRLEQIQANELEWAKIRSQLTDTVDPTWIVGDSTQIDTLVSERADLVFSCPPYADLEKYSDDPADLSNMSYEDFCTFYGEICTKSVDLLKDDSFIVWVIGDVRDKKGIYRGLIPETIRAFEEAGAHYYNEAILVSPVGSLAMRASKMFTTSRKLGKTHQTVLVFVKGDPKKATERCGTVEVTLPVEDSDPSQ